MKKPVFLAVAAAGLAVLIILGLGKSPMQPGGFSEAIAADSDGGNSGMAVATFAGGCFWCVESTFEKLEGVSEAVSGYAGGSTENPTYYDVGSGKTGHTEVVQIRYDPAVISYPELLHWLWREIDPTDPDGQFVDRGSMYRPAVFYHDDQQKAWLEESLEDLASSGRYAKPLLRMRRWLSDRAFDRVIGRMVA